MHGIQLTYRAFRALGRSRGGVAILFGLMALPMAMAVGLAIDLSFLAQAKAQLSLAADAAAIHAARVASQSYSSGLTNDAGVAAVGQNAGKQWFTAQIGTLTSASVSIGNVSVAVTNPTSPGGYQAVVTYAGSVTTHFGGLFNISTWPVGGSATAVINNKYFYTVLMLDNSPSTLIGAEVSDMLALEQETPCTTYAVNADGKYAIGQSTFVAPPYSWSYAGNYGYRDGNLPPPATQNGTCDPAYTGDPSLCAYMTTFKNVSHTNSYQCTNGGGTTATITGTTYYNVPNAPCAFACHSSSTNNDNFGMARAMSPKPTLRLDVIANAAATILTKFQQLEQSPKQITTKIFQFANGSSQIFPSGSQVTSDLAAGLTVVRNTVNTPFATGYNQDTDFSNSINNVNGSIGPGGDGSTPSSPIKVVFIITDGVNDSFGHGNGGMTSTSVSTETLCSQFWNRGMSVYVLYTPYYPMPNYYYENRNAPHTEPIASSEVMQAMQACARYPANLILASDTAAIDTAVTNLMAGSLNGPARVTQ